MYENNYPKCYKMVLEIVSPCCVNWYFKHELYQATLEMDVIRFEASRLKQTHDKATALCVFSDNATNEAGDTHSSLGEGLEKNSLYSWCSSWHT